MANIFTKRGQEAKESMEQSGGVDLKEVYIRLKDGESVRVRVLSPMDYVEYLAVGDFNLGIFTQPSLLPLGKSDAFAEAKAIADELAGDDENHPLFPFTRLYGKKRYVFAFADLDTGKLRVWDASKKQAKAIITSIEKYKEDIGDIAFDFSRTGNKLETVYALDPILRLKGDDVEKFEKLGELTVEDEVFNQVLIARTYEQQVEILEKAGFPVAEYFDVEAVEEEPEETPAGEVSEEELPF